MLFGDKQRNDMRRRELAETPVGYLHRSGRPETEQAREFMSRLFEQYPEPIRKSLLGRLHKATVSNGDMGQSPMAEMLLYSFLSAVGADVEIEPSYGGLHPDFRIVDTVHGYGAFPHLMEVTSVKGLDLDNDVRFVADSLNKIISPDRRIVAEIFGASKQLTGHNAIKGHFANLLNYGGDETTSDYKENGWHIRGTIIPAAQPSDDESFVPVVISMHRRYPRNKNIDLMVRDNVKAKLARYRQLPEDMIVAVNIYCHDRSAIEGAMFGRHRKTGEPAPPLGSVTQQRERSEGFTAQPGFLRGKLLGILAISALQPYRPSEIETVYYPNPRNHSPQPDWTRKLTHAVYHPDGIEIVPGYNIASFT